MNTEWSVCGGGKEHPLRDACRRNFNHFQQVKLHYVCLSFYLYVKKTNKVFAKKRKNQQHTAVAAAAAKQQTKESKICDKITSLWCFILGIASVLVYCMC